MFSHHSDQISQRSQVSLGSLCLILNQEWLSQWQSHILICPGQLKRCFFYQKWRMVMIECHTYNYNGIQYKGSHTLTIIINLPWDPQCQLELLYKFKNLTLHHFPPIKNKMKRENYFIIVVKVWDLKVCLRRKILSDQDPKLTGNDRMLFDTAPGSNLRKIGLCPPPPPTQFKPLKNVNFSNPCPVTGCVRCPG